MSNAAPVLDLESFRRRREAQRAAQAAAAEGPAQAAPALVPVAPLVAWAPQAAPLAWAPFYVWMPVLMVLG